MKHLTSKIPFLGLVFGFGLATLPARAEIYLDRESEPLPLVDLKVVLPAGFDLTSRDAPAAANVLGDILESGTARLDRTAFLEKLADFGATANFTVGNNYSQWELSFPLVEGKNYDELVAALKENWQQPRWTDEAFATAKIKLQAAYQGSLDRDPSLAVSLLRRWLNKYQFGGRPAYLEDVTTLKKDQTKAIFEKYFVGAKAAWAGAVAPDSAEPLVKRILSEVFGKQGKITTGAYLKQLPVEKFETKQPETSKTVLIIDKEARAQTVTTVLEVNKTALPGKEELAYFFGSHIFWDSGLGSVFSNEIRTKRGLAYAVQSVGNSFHDRPTVSLFMNPGSDRMDEALQTAASLFQQSFVTGATLKDMAPEAWNQQFQSFRYGRVLTRGTPAGRLAERLAVVTGDISPEFYKSDVNKWKVKVDDVNRIYSDIYKNGAFAMALVGSAKDLRPLVEKHFPGSKIRVINYRDTISSKAFPDKLD